MDMYPSSGLVGVVGTDSGKDMSMKAEKEGVGDGERMLGGGLRGAGEGAGERIEIWGGDLGSGIGVRPVFSRLEGCSSAELIKARGASMMIGLLGWTPVIEGNTKCWKVGTGCLGTIGCSI